jgi:hypothetical protein
VVGGGQREPSAEELGLRGREGRVEQSEGRLYEKEEKPRVEWRVCDGRSEFPQEKHLLSVHFLLRSPMFRSLEHLVCARRNISTHECIYTYIFIVQALGEGFSSPI